MAISRHSTEWKRTIATAALLGVELGSYFGTARDRMWVAKMPNGHLIRASSQIMAARKALLILGAKISDLPDAAEAAAPASGADGLRSNS